MEEVKEGRGKEGKGRIGISSRIASLFTLLWRTDHSIYGLGWPHLAWRYRLFTLHHFPTTFRGYCFNGDRTTHLEPSWIPPTVPIPHHAAV